MYSEKASDLAKKIEDWRSERQKKVGARIKEERKRLGLSLVEMSRRVGIHRNTQTNYESGDREPDHAYYQVLFELGFNLAYINSGENLDEIASHAAAIAVKVFKHIDDAIFSDDVSMLFYIFGLNEAFIETGISDELMSEQQEIALVQEVLKKSGGNFSIACEAVFKFTSRLNEHGKITPKLRAELILETIRLYSENKSGGMREIARELVEDILYQRQNKR